MLPQRRKNYEEDDGGCPRGSADGRCGVHDVAAANPFSDVPRDHWAYDAVTQLAADGVVEGYGDGTFRGDRNIDAL